MAIVEITTKIDLDATTAARWFCSLDDEQQADFFIEVARQAQDWKGYQGQQWFMVGRHLRNCSCSTEQARDLIRELHNGVSE